MDCAVTGAAIKDEPGLVKVELGQDRLFCAVWSGSRIAQNPMTLETYLASSHLQISADGVSEGLADAALRERGLRRNVVATISNYLVLPWALRGTELITHCGDGILHILDDTSEVRLISPPLPISNVRTSLILHRQMANDPGTNWLRELITEIYLGARARKHHEWAGQCDGVG